MNSSSSLDPMDGPLLIGMHILIDTALCWTSQYFDEYFPTSLVPHLDTFQSNGLIM